MGKQFSVLLMTEYVPNAIGIEYIVMITMLISVLIVMSGLSLNAVTQAASTVSKDLKDRYEEWCQVSHYNVGERNCWFN